MLVCNAFLRSLARLDLPPSRVGALAGEIEARTERRRGAGLGPGGRGKMPTMPAKRILVTGATGFIGGLLAARLLDDGFRSAAWSATPRPRPANALDAPAASWWSPT